MLDAIFISPGVNLGMQAGCNEAADTEKNNDRDQFHAISFSFRLMV
jgi:hypothetical protein